MRLKACQVHAEWDMWLVVMLRPQDQVSACMHADVQMGWQGIQHWRGQRLQLPSKAGRMSLLRMLQALTHCRDWTRRQKRPFKFRCLNDLARLHVGACSIIYLAHQ